ncbi:hypothetical protein [Sphingomonas jatrophae]|uniref:Uncharacterized protein n=1 Tax=Sphingomonas jatrophae TaxID=1166337 RepID=A0A1I6JLH9_9SPHN|nr:hypothetical protein [Sphingomonas jatrophae]SFR79777.1 hypothetical protein SAMN05192580_0457 [Sphingomonas jatrophae]
MQTEIAPYDAARRTVGVTFTHAGVVHQREVNACHDGDGAYDAEATAARVEAVASGVAVKIAAGAITNPPAPADDDAAPGAAVEA